MAPRRWIVNKKWVSAAFPAARVPPALILAALLPAALLLVSCGTDAESPAGAPAPSQYEVRDSADVRIVENRRPAPDSRVGWVVGAEPAVSIGSVEGGRAYQLFRANDATRLSDGRIVVANGGTSQLLVFDPTGSHLTSWGRKGQGPGEFIGGGTFEVEPWPGDSVMVCHGIENHYLSLFDSRGNFGRSYRLRSNVEEAGFGAAAFADVLPDRSIIAGKSVRTEDYPPRTSAFTRAERDYLILAADGSVRADLGRHPGREDYWYRGAFGFMLQSPFGRLAVSAAWGELAVVGTNDRYEIRAYDVGGALVRIVRRDHDMRHPAQGELSAHLEWRYLANLTEEDWRERMATVIRSVPPVETLPAFTGIMADALGYLWVEEFRLDGEAPGAPSIWTVFDREGRVQGFVETPSGLAIHEIGADYILGTTRDELQVQYVQLWPLSR